MKKNILSLALFFLINLIYVHNKAFANINQDIFGLYHNPAKNSNMAHVGSIYQSGYNGDTSWGLSIKPPIIDLEFSLYRYNSGALYNGINGQTDTLFAINAHRKIFNSILIGGNVKYLNSSLFDNLSAKTFMFDIGTVIELKYFDIIASGLNIGGSLNYGIEDEQIPFITRFGLVLYTSKIGNIKDFIDASLGIDYVRKSIDNYVRIGGEIYFNKMLTIGSGIEIGSSRNFSLGFGLDLTPIQLDYSFLYSTDIRDSIHTVGLTYNFVKTSPTYRRPASTRGPASIAYQPIVKKIGSLNFRENDSNLDSTMKKYLSQQSDILFETNFDTLYISGHASRAETNARKLSLDRAKNTALFLVKQGIQPEKIAIKGSISNERRVVLGIK